MPGGTAQESNASIDITNPITHNCIVNDSIIVHANGCRRVNASDRIAFDKVVTITCNRANRVDPNEICRNVDNRVAKNSIAPRIDGEVDAVESRTVSRCWIIDSVPADKTVLSAAVKLDRAAIQRVVDNAAIETAEHVNDDAIAYRVLPRAISASAKSHRGTRRSPETGPHDDVVECDVLTGKYLKGLIVGPQNGHVGNFDILRLI